jgi:cytochrome b involved in lipid metabolism
MTSPAREDLTPEEVAQHNKPDDAWISIHGKVYDVTPFLNDHPGGKKILLRMAGKDATQEFDNFHKIDVLQKYGSQLYVGNLAKRYNLIELPFFSFLFFLLFCILYW